MGVSRRKFLLGTGLVGGGLILGISLRDNTVPYPAAVEGSFNPNAWLQITEDGQFIFQLHKAEMGQGVYSTLPLILCEELDLDPQRLVIQHSGLHPDFADPMSGAQITGGSNSIATSYDTLRDVGAAARAMLVAAAAAQWNTRADQCRTVNGEVISADGSQRLDYAALAMAAKNYIDVPYQLKSPDQFRYIGQPQTRLDAQAKSTGQAQFGVDVKLSGMKTAVVLRCPHYGGSVASWDSTKADSMPGVVAVRLIHSGIAVVADSYWQARKAADAIKINWDKGPLAGLDSAEIKRQQLALFDTEEARPMLEVGDPATAKADAATIVEAGYSVPFTHHSPMEPQNGTAILHQPANGGATTMEMWLPTQTPDMSAAVAAHFTSLGKADITVHSQLMGGAFGRRGYPDFAGEVAAIAEQLPNTAIKLQWSREDDMQHDYYRASSEHQLSAALDAEGGIVSWEHTLVASSIIKTMTVTMAAALLPDWVPASIAESLGKGGGKLIADYDSIPSEGAKIPYTAPNIRVGQIEYDSGIPTGFWRSVGFSYNVFVVESFFDELAASAGVDPVDYRRRYLAEDSQWRKVLDLAAEKANWGNAGNGIYQGIAISKPFGTYCAMVVDVRLDESGKDYSIEKVTSAVDCGIVVDPDTIETQMQGGIIYALSAAVKAPVTFSDGAAVESNFHDLPVMRMNEIPKAIEVYTVDSNASPTGIGEIGVPALAPALANALYAATGQRLRDMPLLLS